MKRSVIRVAFVALAPAALFITTVRTGNTAEKAYKAISVGCYGADGTCYGCGLDSRRG